MSTKIASTTLYFALPERETVYHKLIHGFCASLCKRFCLSFVALNKIEKKRLKAPRNGKRYFNFVAKFFFCFDANKPY